MSEFMAYDEIHTVDLNEPALGSGWDASAINGSAAGCLGSVDRTNRANPDKLHHLCGRCCR